MRTRIKAYFRSLLCRAASWFKYRRPVLVRRYVVIERDTLEEECRNVHNWLAGACDDSKKLADQLDVLRRAADASDKACDFWRQAAGHWFKSFNCCEEELRSVRETIEGERSAAAAQIKSLEGQLNSAIIEAAELQKQLNNEADEHSKSLSLWHNLELKYAKAHRALEDVKRAVGANAS